MLRLCGHKDAQSVFTITKKTPTMRFHPEEGPSRGPLRDCTTSPINRFAALLSSEQTLSLTANMLL